MPAKIDIYSNKSNDNEDNIDGTLNENPLNL